MLTSRTLNSTLDRMVILDRALHQAFGPPGPATATAASGSPTMDVVERKDAYILSAELPGVSPSEVDVGFAQHVLTVRGTKRPAPAIEPANGDELRVYAAERVTGTFERSIRLPEFVDGDRTTAVGSPSDATTEQHPPQTLTPHKTANCNSNCNCKLQRRQWIERTRTDTNGRGPVQLGRLHRGQSPAPFWNDPIKISNTS